MPTFRQILTAHAPVVLIDAASARVQVALLLAGDGTGSWADALADAGTGVFRGLAQLGVQPDHAGAFVYCDGPGSILGVRTVAAALRTWTLLRSRPVFAYHSLAVVAAALGRPGARVIADARRDTWHCLTAGGPLQRVPTAELAPPLVMPEGFRHWSPLPAGVELVPYSLAALIPRVLDAEVLRSAPEPDAFLHEEPSYVTWTPQIHRAP
ncbi:MAG: peptidase M22 [Verrucomicrobia bacterium]|nr:peptidase M22 [Verrucomicrobiota bacterium]